MKKSYILIGLILLLALGVYGQLQQSGGGGSAVNATQAGTWNINNISGAVSLPTGAATAAKQPALGTAGSASADVISVQGIASMTALKVDGSAVTQPVSGTVSVNALPIGSNVIGTVDTIPKTACGNTVASQALAAVPTSATAVFSSTTCVVAVVMNNTTGSAVTVTVTDNAGTPINDILTFSIPANSQLIQPLYGVQFTSGLKWTASGAGVTGAVIGYQ